MRILLLSAYDAQSHRYWREGLEQFLPEYDWTVLSLPPRYFNWRIRGNSLTWAYSHRATLEQNFDLLIATSMVDLSALRGMVPALAAIPSIVYFHENQFAYPGSEQQYSSVEPQMVALYSALCADRVVFNTKYNLSTFITGVESLLKRLPDGVPPNLVPKLLNKSQVLPVPISPEVFFQPYTASDGTDSKRISVVWNHRWEYDKGPDGLLAMLKCLPEDALFTFHVIGQSFRRKPEAFDHIHALLSERNWLGNWGYIENREQYLKTLADSHVVFSTSLHDFQGLSVIEGAACGAFPLVPNRLAYPELFGDESCYESSNGPDNEAAAAAEKLMGLSSDQAFQKYSSSTINNLGWDRLGDQYRHLIVSGK